MDNLTLHLRNVNGSGAYPLDCRVDELHAAVAQAGYVLFEASLAGVAGKDNFIAALARAVNVPDWFGGNWDALADSLSDLSWQPAPGYVLLLRDVHEAFGMDAEDYNTAMEIFTDTTAFWKAKNKPFWIFFADASHAV